MSFSDGEIDFTGIFTSLYYLAKVPFILLGRFLSLSRVKKEVVVYTALIGVVGVIVLLWLLILIF